MSWFRKMFGSKPVDAEDLALYLEKEAGTPQDEDMEERLAGAPASREILLLAASAEENAAEPSYSTINRALQIATGRRESVVEFVLRLRDKAVEVLNTTASPVAMDLVPAGALRGSLATAESGPSVYAHSMGLYKVFVAFRPRRENIGMHVLLEGPGAQDKPVVFRLWEGDREMMSVHAKRGAAVFENVPPGKYRMRIHENHGEIGAIHLQLVAA